MENNGIGVTNLPNLHHNKFIEKGTNFNLLMVGAHGLGKTTFINSFLNRSVLPLNPFEPKDASNTPGQYETVDFEVKRGLKNPFWQNESICNIQVSNLEIHEFGVNIKMEITEVDGIGDALDNEKCYTPIVELLKSKFRDYDRQFKEMVKSRIDDKRIHLCLYFLEPITYLKKSDFETIKHISEYCNVIPIVSKSDLLNEEERSTIIGIISERLLMSNISLFSFEEMNDNDEMEHISIPFFITSGCPSKQDFGAFLREYSWGSFDASVDLGNDFNRLRKVILQGSTIRLIQETEYLYDNFRMTQLAQQLIGKDPKSFDKSFVNRLESNNAELDEIKERIGQKRGEIEKNVLKE